MKRFFTLVIIFSLVFSFFAEFSCTPACAAATKDSKSKSSESGEPFVIESKNESSPDNPIGDDSSYYNIDDLGGAPDISAESAILMDAVSGAVIYGHQSKTKRYPASITKTMTALLVIENCRMDEIVTFSKEAVYGVEGSSAGINVGAEMTVEDALYAMMLVSANEAAAALAEHVAGSVDAFADMMNKRAEELGCTGTHFTNPHGLPDEDHYTTARDMALILRQAMKYDEFRKVAETITYTIEKNDTLNSSIELWNHAKILRENSEYYYKYAEGSKTGFTQAALNTLVTYAKKGDTELICVILKDYGADCSYNDTKALFKWGFKKVDTIFPLSETKFKSIVSSTEDLKDSKKEAIISMKTSYNKNYSILVQDDFDDSDVKLSFALDEDKKSKRLGYIEMSYGDNVIGRTPVTYKGSSLVDLSDPDAGKEDDLVTAPNSDNSLKPHKVLKVFMLIVFLIIVIFFILLIIRRKNEEKAAANRKISRRKHGRYRTRHK